LAKAIERDLSRIGWLDYLLTAIGSCLAVFSGGMSINEPLLGFFAVGLIVTGTLASYLIRVRTLESKFIKWDGLIYSCGVIAAIYFSPQLNGMMPDGGFPREIAAAGWLTWMLVFGSFATWQDSTLLFQAIPSLAMFGLVGCYDTYRFVTFNFFAYLMCLATLFARAHGRQMLTQAANSGYFTRGLAPGTPIPSVDTTPGLANDLKRGPWRWVAGPEWALASALGVVLLSLLGAPIIRESVSGIAGLVVLPPPPMKNPAPTTSSTSTSQESDVRVGRGPNRTVSRPVLEAKLDKLRYLREQSYLSYTGRGWRNVISGFSGAQDQTSPNDLASLQMKKYHEVKFQIKLLQNLKLVPCPPEVVSPSFQPAQTPNSTDEKTGQINMRDGNVELITDSSVNGLIFGSSIETDAESVPKNCVKYSEVPKLYDQANIPARVSQLASEVTKGCTTDYERANKISDEISKRILYNLDADATPSDRDPVEYALFDSHQGYCDVYASSMVLMARSVGLPARYVQGYYPNSNNVESNGAYLVTSLDYHAWAEVMFEDVGWVVFDPSIKADFVPGAGIGQAGRGKPWWKENLSTILASLVAFLIATPLVFLSKRIKFKGGKESSPKGDAEKVYAAYLSQLEKLTQVRRPIGRTGDEFVAQLSGKLGGCDAEVQALNQAFMPILYGPVDIQKSDVERLQKETQRILKLVRDKIRQSKATRP